MISIMRLRRQLPLVVFILLLVLFVIALGFICFCASDHPTQAASAPAHAPAVIVLWSLLTLLAAPLFVRPLVEPLRARDRASPAALQRFLF